MPIAITNEVSERPASNAEWAQTCAHLDTPFVLIDGATVERNISRMADYCRMHGIQLRPHIKTHKSLRIAELQLRAGAVGLTVAKPGEASVMSQLGAEVLIAYPSITSASLQAVRNSLAKNEILVALDSWEAIERLESAVPIGGRPAGVLVDIDIGLHRTGVQTMAESVRLAQRIGQSNCLRLDGVFCYPGHIWKTPGTQAEAVQESADIIREHLEGWRQQGLAARIVSGGSTPTAYQSHLMPGVTEIRPGTYVYNDMNTVRGGFCELADCAARIVTSVISNAVPNQIVIDAGSKALAADLCVPAPDSGHGHVVELPDAKIVRLSEEHGQVDVSRCASRPRVGDRLTVIPNHVCPTINLTDEAWWLASDGSLERLLIDARGMVR